MSWEKAAYTRAGAALLSESVSGGALIITRALAATEASDSDLTEAVTLSGETHEVDILGIDTVENDGKPARRVSIQITAGQTTYICHQVGVYGKLDTGPDETLLMVVQDNRGVEIPAASTSSDFKIELAVLLAVSNNANISVTVSPQVQAIIHVMLTLNGSGKGGGTNASGNVTIGQGLKRDESGAIAVSIGDGLAFDATDALTVRKDTVVTSDDLVNDEKLSQEIAEILK